MKRFLTTAAAALLISFAAGGCAFSAKDEAALTFPEPALTLTIQESGKTFPVRVGQYVKISLKENPATGYTWVFRTDTGKPGPQPKSDLPIELAGERLLPSESEQPGALPMHEFMVKAVRVGMADLVGDCLRLREKGAKPEISVRYHFRVTR